MHPFHVVHKTAGFTNDQGSLKLAHVLRIDPEVGLQRNLDANTFRDPDKAATAPYGGVQCRELVVGSRNHSTEVLAKQIRVLAQGCVCVTKNDPLTCQIVTNALIHDL